MKKFYINDKEIPSIEGIVERATGYAQGHRSGQYLLELQINTFQAPVIIPAMTHALRINAGEKVRLYSRLGFDRPRNGCGGLIGINALEILGEDGNVLFSYVGEEGRFKEE